MYDKESLAKINAEYLGSHYRISDQDVKIANDWVALIEASRDPHRPVVGDIIRFTNKYSEYYPHAHIEKVTEDGAEVCESPYVPFVGRLSNNDLYCSTSGGAWTTLEIEKIRYVGKELKTFCDWGSCGVCAHGAIDFEAEVNVWEYTAEHLHFGEFTTRNWRRDFISYCEKDRDGSPYHYFGNYHAYKTEKEYMAWLLTYKGVEFEGNWPNQTVVFFYRKAEYLISREEWDALSYPTDTRMMNGSIMLIKYWYDDEQHVIHEYRYDNKGDLDWRICYPYRTAMERIERGEFKREIRPQTKVTPAWI